MSDDKCPNCGAAMKTWNPIAHCDDDGFVGEWDVHDIDKVECLTRQLAEAKDIIKNLMRLEAQENP